AFQLQNQGLACMQPQFHQPKRLIDWNAFARQLSKGKYPREWFQNLRLCPNTLQPWLPTLLSGRLYLDHELKTELRLCRRPSRGKQASTSCHQEFLAVLGAMRRRLEGRLGTTPQSKQLLLWKLGLIRLRYPASKAGRLSSAALIRFCQNLC